MIRLIGSADYAPRLLGVGTVKPLELLDAKVKFLNKILFPIFALYKYAVLFTCLFLLIHISFFFFEIIFIHFIVHFFSSYFYTNYVSF